MHAFLSVTDTNIHTIHTSIQTLAEISPHIAGIVASRLLHMLDYSNKLVLKWICRVEDLRPSIVLLHSFTLLR